MIEKLNIQTVPQGTFQLTESKLQRELEEWMEEQDQRVVKRSGHIIKKTKPGQDLEL